MRKRIEIVMDLLDPFDYTEFESACRTAGIEPLQIGEYSQKVGMLKVALRSFPDRSPWDAYMSLVTKVNQEMSQPGQVIQPTTISRSTPCGGCGGGKIR